MERRGLKSYIIYNSNEGWELAKLVYKAMQKNSFEVSIINKLPKGNFDEQKYKHEIEPELIAADILIVILSRETLRHYSKPENKWFAKQLDYAIGQIENKDDPNSKIVIPIIDDSTYKKPVGKLPDKFGYLNICNSVFMNEKFYKKSLQNLFNFIIEAEYQKLMTADRNSVKRINNPMYLAKNFENLKDLTPEEVEKAVLQTKKNINARKLRGETLSIDKEIYKEIINKYDKLNVLDLGCGDGSFAKSILSDPSINLNTYVGIDINQNKLQVAKALFGKDNENIHYHKVDLIDNSSHNDLFKCCYHIENGKKIPIKFDLIIIRNLLRHVKEPRLIIELANDLLNKPNKLSRQQIDEIIKQYCNSESDEELIKRHKELNIESVRDMLRAHRGTMRAIFLEKIFERNEKINSGTIIITEQDDGFNVCYPDKHGYFKRFFEILDKCDSSGNRFTGREIYTHLIETNFKDVKLKTLVDHEYDENVRQTNIKEFIDLYDSLINELKAMKEVKPNDKDINLSLSWLLNNRDNVIADTQQDDFFNLNSYMIWVASK